MTLKQFEKQKYLNIETFHKNGRGITTPVWFVQDGETLHVWTHAGSGKAKRIRRDGAVRVAPSTGFGEPLGKWLPARAHANGILTTTTRFQPSPARTCRPAL